MNSMKSSKEKNSIGGEISNETMKLLDFYVLGNPIIEDIYFIELKNRDCIGYCLAAMSTRNHKKPSPCVFVLKNKLVRNIHIEIPIEDRLCVFGEEIDRKEFKSLGIPRGAVSRVWRFSNAADKERAKGCLNAALFSSKNRKDDEVALLIPGNAIKLVPNGNLDELNIDVDLKGIANG